MIVKSYRINKRTKGFTDIHDMTPEVREKIAASEVRDGQVTVFAVGATAGFTTVEYEPGLVKDLKTFFEKLAPQNGHYHHEQTWHDGNGFSHVRASLLKPSLTIPVVSGEMTLARISHRFNESLRNPLWQYCIVAKVVRPKFQRGAQDRPAAQRLKSLCTAALRATFSFFDEKVGLGAWQQIVLVDFDNVSRDREVIVQILGN